MEKTFLNIRNADFTKKAAELQAKGWTQKEKLQERLNAKNLRKHIRNATVKARLPPNSSRVSSANLERMYANVNSILNAEYAHTKDSYVPFYRLYNINIKKNNKVKGKSKSKNNNVTMTAKNNMAEFATSQNVAAMHHYIQRNPHLMNNAQRRKYEKEKHALHTNELVALTSAMRVREANQMNESAAASAVAAPFARTQNTVNKPLPPLPPPITEYKTLQSFMPTEESMYEYSKSKKRLVNTRKYPFRPKKSNLSVKSLAATLPATSAAAAAAAPAVPLHFAMNNNNNNRNNNRNNNNSNNNTTQTSKRQKTNFRFANWK